MPKHVFGIPREPFKQFLNTRVLDRDAGDGDVLAQLISVPLVSPSIGRSFRQASSRTFSLCGAPRCASR